MPPEYDKTAKQGQIITKSFESIVDACADPERCILDSRPDRSTRKEGVRSSPKHSKLVASSITKEYADDR